jgi:microcompartment protein CcmL/EutN
MNQRHPPALALLEFDSIAAGIVAADAIAKKAQLAVLITGTVQPGRLLVLLAGNVANVEECIDAGRAAGGSALVDEVYLPGVHEQVVAALAGDRQTEPVEALGIVETNSAASAIRSADAALKGANVFLLELRFSDGLGGKGLCFFTGAVTDVEAAVEQGSEAVSPGQLVHAAVISQLSPEVAVDLLASTSYSGKSPSSSGR